MADSEPVEQEPQPDGEQGDGAAPEAQQQGAAAEAAEGAATMTKSQLKKLKRRQFYEEKKQRRKEAEKAKRLAEQERRREEGRQRMAAMTEEERQKWREERNARGLARKEERQATKAKMEQALEAGQKLVIDLDFADLMTDTELKSICGQLAYCWHVNCGAQHPVHLALTSLQGKMLEYMQKQVAGYVNWKATVTDKPYIEHFAACKERLVYLTADSENELQELDPEAVYIIGGIVDRNRHKQLCYNKALQQGIKHARLPIGEYVKLASSQVMTTNHIVHILLHWMELRDWKAAFEAVIPNRKRKAEGEAEEDDTDAEGEGASSAGEEGQQKQKDGPEEGHNQQQQQQQQQQDQQQAAGGE